MIKTIMPIIPVNPNAIKKLRFTPDIKRIAIIVIVRIIAVPKSGWSIISPKINTNTNKIGNIEDLIFLILLLVKYLDVNIIIPNLVNSLGWIPKEPIPNQLLEPFLTEPIPGINTSIRRVIQMIMIRLLYFL